MAARSCLLSLCVCGCLLLLIDATHFIPGDHQIDRAANEIQVKIAELVPYYCGSTHKTHIGGLDLLPLHREVDALVTKSQAAAGGRPTIRFPQAQPNKKYTVLMVDPDAPGSGAFLHWLVMNIKGDDIAQGRAPESKTTIAEYLPPNPPAGTGNHRYQIFLMEQDVSSEVYKWNQRRSRFNVKAFFTKSLCNTITAVYEYKCCGN